MVNSGLVCTNKEHSEGMITSIMSLGWQVSRLHRRSNVHLMVSVSHNDKYADNQLNMSGSKVGNVIVQSIMKMLEDKLPQAVRQLTM